MKKIILICIALIALFATQVRSTDYHPSDQLQTHSFVQQSASVLFASFELPVKPVYMFGMKADRLVTILQVPGETMPTTTFAVIDPGLYRNRIANSFNKCNPIGLMYSYKSPTINQKSENQNYNTLNYNYGLRG